MTRHWHLVGHRNPPALARRGVLVPDRLSPFHVVIRIDGFYGGKRSSKIRGGVTGCIVLYSMAVEWPLPVTEGIVVDIFGALVTLELKGPSS